MFRLIFLCLPPSNQSISFRKENLLVRFFFFFWQQDKTKYRRSHWRKGVILEMMHAIWYTLWWLYGKRLAKCMPQFQILHLMTASSFFKTFAFQIFKSINLSSAFKFLLLFRIFFFLWSVIMTARFMQGWYLLYRVHSWRIEPVVMPLDTPFYLHLAVIPYPCDTLNPLNSPLHPPVHFPLFIEHCLLCFYQPGSNLLQSDFHMKTFLASHFYLHLDSKEIFHNKFLDGLNLITISASKGSRIRNNHTYLCHYKV